MASLDRLGRGVLVLLPPVKTQKLEWERYKVSQKFTKSKSSLKSFRTSRKGRKTREKRNAGIWAHASQTLKGKKPYEMAADETLRLAMHKEGGGPSRGSREDGSESVGMKRR